MKKAKLYFILTNLVLIIVVLVSQVFLVFKIYEDLTSSYFKEIDQEKIEVIRSEEIKSAIEKIKSLNSY